MAIPLPYPPHLPLFRQRLAVLRVTTFCLIGLLHGGLFYALNKGLLHQTSMAVPQVVSTMLITEQAPLTAAPQPRSKKIPPHRRLATAPRQTTQTQATARPAQQPDAPALRESTPAQDTSASATTLRTTSETPTMLAAAIPAATAQPQTVSAVDYLQAPSPEYPPAARRKGEQGTVQLRVLVNAEGRAERVEILKSSDSARLDEAARLAVLRAVFKPYLENGHPMAVYAIVPIRFQLG